MWPFLRQPGWTRFVPSRMAVNIATLGPLGRLPAPGTWGSLAGVGWYAAVCAPISWWAAWLVIVFGLYLALAFCGEAEKRLGKIDPSEVILDEFASMPIIYATFRDQIPGPHAWVILLLGFGLFRFFDILKPLGIRELQRFHGGFGILIDDVAAALAACAVLQVLLRFTPLLTWVGLAGSS